jgi:hypothetical protein
LSADEIAALARAQAAGGAALLRWRWKRTEERSAVARFASAVAGSVALDDAGPSS